MCFRSDGTAEREGYKSNQIFGLSDKNFGRFLESAKSKERVIK